jgi:hypothetical protein
VLRKRAPTQSLLLPSLPPTVITQYIRRHVFRSVPVIEFHFESVLVNIILWWFFWLFFSLSLLFTELFVHERLEEIVINFTILQTKLIFLIIIRLKYLYYFWSSQSKQSSFTPQLIEFKETAIIVRLTFFIR